jgi:hypothetical protein
LLNSFFNSLSAACKVIIFYAISKYRRLLERA